jgi:tetratricopeptide (TPR) repeat protein
MLVTRKAQELDVVELTEDLPEFGLKRGDRGAVVAAFGEPDEAYDLEFVDESGQSRFAYSIKPNHILNVEAVAKETYEKGVESLKSGASFEGRRKLREAIRMSPTLIGVLLNSVLDSFGSSDDWDKLISVLHFVCGLSPDYELARNNLAIAYLNRGVQQSKYGDLDGALRLMYPAIGIATSLETSSLVRQNLAATHTSLAMVAHKRSLAETNQDATLKYLKDALDNMAKACAIEPTDVTKHNLGLAHAFLGNALVKLGDNLTAAAFFELAEDMGTRFPELHNNHGVALAFSGNLDAAVEQFEAALQLEPQHTSAHFNIAQVEQAKSEGKPTASSCRTEEIVDLPFGEVPVGEAYAYQASA